MHPLIILPSGILYIQYIASSTCYHILPLPFRAHCPWLPTPRCLTLTAFAWHCCFSCAYHPGDSQGSAGGPGGEGRTGEEGEGRRGRECRYEEYSSSVTEWGISHVLGEVWKEAYKFIANLTVLHFLANWCLTVWKGKLHRQSVNCSCPVSPCTICMSVCDLLPGTGHGVRIWQAPQCRAVWSHDATILHQEAVHRCEGGGDCLHPSQTSPLRPDNWDPEGETEGQHLSACCRARCAGSQQTQATGGHCVCSGGTTFAEALTILPISERWIHPVASSLVAHIFITRTRFWMKWEPPSTVSLLDLVGTSGTSNYWK